ncbi:hypothetical protein C5F52_14220 [Limnohabitans sp. TS-CS-82]|uniref:hypothetical protein n=1 Tax=Limnohabitans sp. TS-CS-82 TaxID=2094193 RepID=UPI000CF2A13A|nr:hypothetical protein [Limnohabitans sp. TS-CS-82]PQA82731.1 hypothetical protein C5F52_14220 [Limnohabitans sp. TS-CS-82]
MSLEQQLSDAIAAQNALTQAVATWKGQADQSLAAALAAVPVTDRVYWVNSATGNDASADGSAAAPLKTISAACARVPVGSRGTITLVGSGDSVNPLIHTITTSIYLARKSIQFKVNDAGVKMVINASFSLESSLVQLVPGISCAVEQGCAIAFYQTDSFVSLGGYISLDYKFTSNIVGSAIVGGDYNNSLFGKVYLGRVRLTSGNGLQCYVGSLKNAGYILAGLWQCTLGSNVAKTDGIVQAAATGSSFDIYTV